MTTDLAAPAQSRPPHINRHWWYRATWHARQLACDDYSKANRPEDVTIDRSEHPRASYTVSTEVLIESVTKFLDDGMSPQAIATRLDTTVNALEQRFRRRGLTHLSGPFLKARKEENMHPCADCETLVGQRAKRCVPCAALEVNTRPEIRVVRSESALLHKFGKGRAA